MPPGVQSIERSLRILRCFTDAPAGGGLRAAEVGRQLSLPSSTVHRIIRYFVDAGFLEPRGRGFVFGSAIVELGLLAQRQRGLHLIGPELANLQEITGATVDLAIRSGDSALLVARSIPASGPQADLRRPLHATALGKVLLAWDPARRGAPPHVDASMRLPAATARTIVDPQQLFEELGRVRDAGFALNDEESAVGVRTVAVPILDRHDIARYALAVRATPLALPTARIPEVLRHAQACVSALSVLLIPPEHRS